MGIANYTLPDYLKPMDDATAQRLQMGREEMINQDAERQQQMRQRDQQMMQKNFDRMQARLLMSKIEGEGKTLGVALGDPEMGKYQAILNNAGELSRDNPQQYAPLIEGVQKVINQKRGLANFQARVKDLITQGMEPDKATTQAWFENAGELGGASGISANVGRIISSRDTAARAKASADAADKRAQFLEEGRNKRAEAKAKATTPKLPRATEIQLQSLSAELRSVNSEIEKFTKDNVVPIGQEPPREYMVLKNRQTRLQNQIAKLSGPADQAQGAAESPGDVGDNNMPDAAPTGTKRLRWNGTGFEEVK